MRQFCIICCLLASVAGCDNSPPTVSVSTPGQSYEIRVSTLQRIQQECGVSAQEAGSIAVARLKANKIWIDKLEERYASYLKHRGSQSQYEAEVVQLQQDFGLTRQEAIAEVADFPDFPDLVQAAESIGLPKPPPN